MKSRILRGTVGSTSVTSTTSPPSFVSTPTARRPFHSNCTNRILPTTRLLLRHVVFNKRRLVKLAKHSEFGALPESRTNFETTRALHTRNGAASIAPDLCTLHRRNLHLRGWYVGKWRSRLLDNSFRSGDFWFDYRISKPVENWLCTVEFPVKIRQRKRY